MFKRFWWMFLVMLPVGALVGLLFAAVVTYVMPKMYESEAVIEVRPRGTGDSQLGPRIMTPQFFGTEFEVIKSRNSLEKVVAHLELVNRWNVDKESAIEILKRIATTQNIRGTDLISIRVRHANKEDARDITEEVAKVYKEYRAEMEGKEVGLQLQELSKAVRDQEDKVEERRKVLSTIARVKGIVYMDKDLSPESGPEEDQRSSGVAGSYSQLEQQKRQLEGQTSSLLHYEGDQLMVYAASLELPDNIIRKLYPQYLEAKRNVEVSKINGLSDRHPTMIAEVEKIDVMKRQLDDGIVKLRATLQAHLDLATEGLKRAIAEDREKAAGESGHGLDAQDYEEAKRDFETDQGLLESLKLKQIGETISSKIPSESVVIHDEPVIGDRPVSPNVTLNLALGTALGLLLSPLMALPVMWIMNRVSPANREKPAKSPDVVVDF